MRFIRYLNKHKGIIISLLALIAAVTFFYRGLIIEPGIMSRYDYTYFFAELNAGEQYNQWFQTWESARILAGPESGFSKATFSPLYFLIMKLHMLPSPSTYIFLSLLLSGIFCYLFVYHYTKNIYGSTAAGILYAVNWFLESNPTAPQFFLGYLLFPLLFLLFDRALKKGRFRDLVFFSLFTFIFIASSHPHNYYIALFFLALFALFRVFIPPKSGLLVRLVNVSKSSFISLALILGLLAYQFVPLIGGVEPLAVSMTYAKEEVGYFSNPLAMVFSMVTGPSSIALASDYFLLGIIMAALAFSAILFRRDIYIVFFTIVALVAIFLAKGTEPPFASAFGWLWDYLPGFDTIRRVGRFHMITALSYAFLIGTALKFISIKMGDSHRIKFRHLRTSLTITLVGVIIAINFLSVKNLIFAPTVQAFDAKQYPQYNETEEVYDLIAGRDEGIYTTLLIFRNDLVLNESVENPIIGGPYYLTEHPVRWLYPNSRQPVLAYPREDVSLVLSQQGRFIDSQVSDLTIRNLSETLGSANVKYIIVDKQKIGNYIRFFQMQDNCKPIYEGETLIVFENGNALPHLYPAPLSFKVFGGLNSLSALQLLPNFSFGNINLLPLDSPTNTDFLILYNAGAEEFAMLNTLQDEWGIQKLNIDKFAKPTWWRSTTEETLQLWVTSDWWTVQGDFAYGGLHLRTGAEATVNIPFSVDESGDYEMWFRIAFATNRGELNALIDGEELPYFPLTPKADFVYGFSVVRTPLHLEKGEHVLEIVNDGSGFNDIDEVFLIKSDRLGLLSSSAARNTPVKVVYYQEVENLFGLENFENWSIYDWTGLSTVITDDDQTEFWNVTDPEQTRVSDNNSELKVGDNSLKIEVNGERPHWTVIYHRYPELQDWSEQDVISFYFYGNDTGNSFCLNVEEDKEGEKWAEFYWKDDFLGWKQLTFPIDKQEIDWTKVGGVVWGINQNPATGIWHLDELTLGKTEVVTVGRSPEDARLHMTIGNESITFGDSNNNRFAAEFGWFEAGPITLGAESQIVKLSNEGEVLIDKIMLYPHRSQSNVDNLFSIDNNTTLSYKKLAPTKYQIHVNTDKPFWIVFSEIYHPLWYAYVDDESIESTQTYLGFNSFQISEIGEYDLILEFKGQQYLEYGAIVSFSTLGIMLIGGIFNELRARRKKE